MRRHLFKLSQMPPHEQTSGGYRIKANKHNFPLLEGMSLYKLILHPKSVREPHWHANAAELGYCLQGDVLITLYDTNDSASAFFVQGGDAFLIPSGALHAIENVGEGQAELLLNFSHADPEDFNLSSTLGTFSDSVLGNTWSKKSAVFKHLKRSLMPTLIAINPVTTLVPEYARYASPYRYHLEGAEPLLSNSGGSARMARQNTWPIAKNQALYSLRLTQEGMREPHWHPETAELGYVRKGQGRMSILSPEGHVDTYIMEEGDIYFIPKAYPHHIENVNQTELHLLIFFDQGMPRDIGLTGSVRAYSNEMLAAACQTTAEFFDNLPRAYADAFIVEKINPTEDFSAKT